MGLTTLIIIAIGLAMDAFAVSIAIGSTLKKREFRILAMAVLYFGIFQGAMPILGWLTGSAFQRYIMEFDHWVAFILLAFIGGKMIYEAFEDEFEAKSIDSLTHHYFLILAIATSIDALIIGFSFALLKVALFQAVIIIGLITGFFSALGVIIGKKVGMIFGKYAEILGGSVLILLGLKILNEHIHFL